MKAQTSVKTEVLSGIALFLTMSYIMVVNPAILSDGTGMEFRGVATATVILCMTMTLLMGLYAKRPFAIGPGMGLNAIFTYDLVLSQGIPWQTGLGIVFWSGVIFIVLSVTPIRTLIAKAIPVSLRVGVAAGIGLFLCLIGFRDSGLVVSHPATLLTWGGIGASQLLCGAAILVIIIMLKSARPFAFLSGMAVATLLGFACMVLGPVTGVISPSEAGTLVTIPESLVSLPDFSSVLLHLDIWGALKFAYLPAILTFLFTDLFDSISTFVAVSQKAGMMVDGQPERLKESLEVDAVATLTASFLGTTSGTTFAESIVAVLTGGRTGLTAVVTALCFVPCLFLAPLAEMIPSFATGAVLIVSGALMLQSLKDLDFEDLASFIPAALTTICVGLLFSITQGICIGFISHTVMHVCAGRAREVKPLMYLLATLAVLILIIQGTN